MLDPDEKDAKGLPLPARAVFVVGPDKRLTLHPVPRHHRPQLPRGKSTPAGTPASSSNPPRWDTSWCNRPS